MHTVYSYLLGVFSLHRLRAAILSGIAVDIIYDEIQSSPPTWETFL